MPEFGLHWTHSRAGASSHLHLLWVALDTITRPGTAYTRINRRHSCFLYARPGGGWVLARQKPWAYRVRTTFAKNLTSFPIICYWTVEGSSKSLEGVVVNGYKKDSGTPSFVSWGSCCSFLLCAISNGSLMDFGFPDIAILSNKMLARNHLSSELWCCAWDFKEML